MSLPPIDALALQLHAQLATGVPLEAALNDLDASTQGVPPAPLPHDITASLRTSAEAAAREAQDS